MKVKFLDNNILALPEHKEILSELVQKNIKCQFTQALDIRLLDSENSCLLSQLNHLGEYVFAFDSWICKTLIEEKMSLLCWRKPYQLKFLVYVRAGMPLAETVRRIAWIKKNQCLAHVMIDISCWKSENSDFYADLEAYSSQVHLFKKMEFATFLNHRHKNKERIGKSTWLWDSCL